MDPFTHALAGAVIASFSGNPVSISDPVLLGAIVGSLAPDFDIVCQLRGHMAYLKNHRGFSHSLLGIGGMSGGIAALLCLIFPGAAFAKVFLWTLLGTLSHVFLDFLNSYGAQLLWPIKKKYNLAILTIFDPILILMMALTLLGQGKIPHARALGVVGIMLYLLFRCYMRLRVKYVLKKRFPGTKELAILPSVTSIWSWHFLIEVNNRITVGELVFFSWACKIRKSFKMRLNHPVIRGALNSKLGKMFAEFTPFYHVGFSVKKGLYKVQFVDLRYYLAGDFMHHATGIVDKDFQLREGIFHPYSRQTSIKITG